MLEGAARRMAELAVQQRGGRAARGAAFAALAAASILGCHDPGNEDDPVCPRTAAAFDVHLTAADGELPPGTRISVTYGGASTEHYTVGEVPNANHSSVCCVPGDGDGLSLAPATCGQPLGDASLRAADADEVRCLIWSNGAADVLVEARGYPLIAETLAAKEDERYPECGAWDTILVPLELTRGDAGHVKEF